MEGRGNERVMEAIIWVRNGKKREVSACMVSEELELTTPSISALTLVYTPPHPHLLHILCTYFSILLYT